MSDYDLNFLNGLFGTGKGAWNIFKSEDKYEIHVDLPGIKKKDIDLSFSNKRLTIKTHRPAPKEQSYITEVSYGDIDRSIIINTNIDHEKIRSKLADGVLIITLPRSEDTLSNKIEVK